jgi:hypothetical protein
MSDAPRFDASIVLPFGDDEEAIGVAVKRVAERFRALGLSFEILAVDEDSGDNSHAVLAMIRAEVPEVRVIHAPGRGRGVEAGTARAQGTILVLSTPSVAAGTLDGLSEACRRVLASQSEVEIHLGSYTVAHRVRSLPVFHRARLVGDAMHRRLVRRLQLHGLDVRVSGPSGAAVKRPVGRLRAFAARATAVARSPW